MPQQTYSMGYMNITVNNLPATAQLTITLVTPQYAWTNDDPNQTNVGVSLVGAQGTAFPLVSMQLTTTSIVLVAGGETASFSIGVPISYPTGTSNPTANGNLTINLPANATVYMNAGGPQQQVPINAPWTVPIS